MSQEQDLMQLLERLTRIVYNDAGAEGLNPVQWEALRYFSSANRFSNTPSGLTGYLGVTKGTVSQTVNALERKGLIKKNHNKKGDRRSVNVTVTKKGRSLLDVNPLLELESSVETLGTKDVTVLSSGLRRILTDALVRRGGKPFGVCQTCQHFQRSVSGGKPHRCGLLEVPLSDADSQLICREYQ